jgi:uncharacterized protein
MGKLRIGILILILVGIVFSTGNSRTKARFKILAFYTAKNDQAHISFVNEANQWFNQMALKHNFEYQVTNDWQKLNSAILKDFNVIIFLDSRPEDSLQRSEFQKYMENGGGWMGFHFAAFALTPSSFPQDWNWYHTTFLGCGEYKGNTWRPTPAVLKVENGKHPATRHLPETFVSAPNEWYSWKNDLRVNPSIEILISVDPVSFPLGTGPKPHEIWHEGYFPVVWTNKNYRMLYINMGHNDIDYESTPSKELSFTFKNETQNKLVLDGLFWISQGHR